MINGFLNRILWHIPIEPYLRGIFHLLFIIIIYIGMVILQMLFSKKENKWIGIILPIIVFCNSLIYIPSIGDFFINIYILPIGNFLAKNIKTVILLFIYIFFRRRNKQSALDKMNIQDLE